MELSVATPEKMIFSGPVEDILINADKGQLNILDRHANLISLVRPGYLVVNLGNEKKTYEVSEGLLKVEDNKVSVLCNSVAAA